MKNLLLLSMSVVAATAAALPAFAGQEWKIRKSEWSTTDERNYQSFVTSIGESGCNTFARCLAGSGNPYRATDPAGTRYFSDCADLPYNLRSYFAWKNNLPFGYESGVVSEDGGDIRYSKTGNKVSSRRDALTRNGRFVNGMQMMTTLSNTISSAMFRLNPEHFDATNFSDMYSTKLDRKGIRPGTTIYDVAGHVAVVYKVGNDGRVFYIDSHPDNSLTHGEYGMKFERSRPAHGAGFKNWRPVTLVGATVDGEGNLLGGKLVAKSNSQIEDFSVVQFYGTQRDPSDWRKGKFVWKGRVVGYYDYVRFALAVGDLKYNPVEELANMLKSLCNDTQDRVRSVSLAIGKGIQSKEHPAKLPSNIYGTSGEWEEYSTPSRDARLKTSFREMRIRTEEFVTKWKAHDPSIVYPGGDLKGDLLDVYNRETAACTVTYTKSNGEAKVINLGNVLYRLYDLSFDPYHCIELRWGAPADERASCGDGNTKTHWYDAEKFLRNQLERKYDSRMDFTADELLRMPPGVGVAVGPDVDVKRFLMAN